MGSREEPSGSSRSLMVYAAHEAAPNAVRSLSMCVSPSENPASGFPRDHTRPAPSIRREAQASLLDLPRPKPLWTEGIDLRSHSSFDIRRPTEVDTKRSFVFAVEFAKVVHLLDVTPGGRP